jgi:NADH-quinone oxidoreductase subunit L
MFELLWLVPALPFTSFVLLVLWGARLPHRFQSLVGAGMTAVSAVLATIVSVEFMASPPAGSARVQVLWTWMQAGSFSPTVAFYLDPLSIVMVLVVTWVSFLILLYSTWFMAHDDGYRRFFAYMNLFVGFMLVLVLADDLLLLYLGWEGVGLCSYLLIGFWYREDERARAALKAFIVTRIGDAALAVGLFLIYYQLGTLNISEAAAQASQRWLVASLPVNAAAALLLGGALGKSAQLPLQTWLPDAMAGPTPVSALIHAATMVTAGVYLIARTHVFFEMAPSVQLVVAIIGAVTLLMAGSSALVQRDIKRVLAYSTMSQIGYMFLALGVGAWVAAIFHFMVHAFFKALLFLCAGVIIKALNDEHDIFNMGGMKRELPLVFWTFLAGAASLSAVPFVTGGFYSKDLILMEAWAAPAGGSYLFLAGLVGSLLTAIYSFRLFFLVFYGGAKQPVVRAKDGAVAIPLVILAALALIGGFVETPRLAGNVTLFSDFLGNVFRGGAPSVAAIGGTPVLLLLSSLFSLGGIYAAYVLFLRRRDRGEALARSAPGAYLHRFLYSGWGFDRVYDVVLLRPFMGLARLMRGDVFNLLSRFVMLVASGGHGLLREAQTGNLRWYATVIALGGAVVIGLVIFL